jgi:hypothetical protein
VKEDDVGFEEFFKTHQHTVSALEAASTFAAATVALFVALASQRMGRTRIRATASIMIVMHETIQAPDYPSYFQVEIKNEGNFPVAIPLSFFYWRAPLKRGYWMVTPLDYSLGDPWVPQKLYPAEIQPRRSQSFYLSNLEMFRHTMREHFAGRRFLDRLRFRFLGAIVRTEDGKEFRVRIDNSVRDELIAIQSERDR